MKKVIGILLAAVLALGLFGCSASDYKKAETAMEAGDYAGAKEIFDGLGDYKDSTELGKKCGYEIALAKLEAKDYSGAKADFEALDGYSNSEEYISKAEDGIIMQKIVGEWVVPDVQLDVGFEALGEVFDGEADISEYADKFEPICYDIRMTINDDGTVESTLYFEPGTLETYTERYTEFLYLVVEQTFEQSCIADGYTMEELYAETGTSSVGELFALASGITLEEYVASAIYESGMAYAFDEDYTYDSGDAAVKDGVITITLGAGYEKGEYDAALDTIVINDFSLYSNIADAEDAVYVRRR